MKSVRAKRTLAQSVEYVVQCIRATGVNVQPLSRRGRILKAVINPDGTHKKGPVTPESPDFEIVLEAIRDLYMLGFIFDHIEGVNETSDLRQRMRLVVKDS